MKTVAVTGGIGSGKTKVCELLASRGVPVYDSDSSVKRLYADDDSLLDSIEEAFGVSVRFSDGSFDSEKLASFVFPDSSKLAVLESIVHPVVLKDFLRWKAMEASRFAGDISPSDSFFGKAPFAVIESAIILDKPDFLSAVDKVVMVEAPLSLMLQRACQRDDVSAEKVIQRMSKQRFDLSRVDAVIRNDGSLEKLKSEVNKIFLGIQL